MPKRVFISYRRDDTAAAAGRVYDRLAHVLKRPNVFFDVSAIGGGEDFVERIEAEIAKSGATLIFIGDKWLDAASPTGKARLWDDGDHVRAEVRAALARSPLVLPVLVGHAKMPKPEQVPDDIAAITTKNALLLRHESFDDDTNKIVAAVLGVAARKQSWEEKGSFWKKAAFALGGALTAAILVLAIALLHYWVLARPLSASIGAPLTTLLLIVLTALGAGAGLYVEARRRKIR